MASYGVVLAYYLSHDYFPGTTPTTYAFIGTLYLSQGVLVSPLATYLVRRFGTHTCLLTGVVLQTTGLLAASFAKQGWQVVLAQGLCAGWGVGFLFVGSVGIQSQWFEKRRSFANAIVSAGTGLGAMIYSLAVQRMIDTIGLHWQYRVLAIVCFAVNTTASLLLRDRNKAVGAMHDPFKFSLMKRPEFLCLQLWAFLTVLAYSALAFSVAPQAVSVGLTHKQGSILTAVYNAGQAIGRPAIGLSSDRFGRMNIALMSTIVSGLLCLAFWLPSYLAPSQVGLLSFFMIISGTTGVFWATIAPLTAETIGLSELPSGLSMIWLTIVPAALFCEPIALALTRNDTVNPYTYAQIFIAIAFLAAALPLMVLRGWRMSNVTRAQKKSTNDSTKEHDQREWDFTSVSKNIFSGQRI